jgi:isopentenyl-diphosphate delta-isomerase
MDATSLRKIDHLRICLERDVESGDTLLDEVKLVHQALPDLDLDQVDTSRNFLGRRLELPLVIAAMTGGCSEAQEINEALAGVAARNGIAFGVGSQRGMIESPELTDTFFVRHVAPEILLLGNVGITALKRYPLERIHEAVRAVQADALCVHINPAQELFQKEGDSDFSSSLTNLRRLCEEASYPVIAKEVGNGISRECAENLQSCGVSAIDLGGAGGTNWVLVDSIRSGREASRFLSWGIPTAISILEARGLGLPLIATGGIRNGVQMAKAILLGADLCGIALPFLRILSKEGPEGVDRYVETLKREFRYTLYLTGSRTISEFRKKPFVVGRTLQEWARQRGLEGWKDATPRKKF